MNKMKSKLRLIYILLCCTFLMYSFSIYIKPSFNSSNHKFDTNKATLGRLVWQKYNCQSCHQLYSLGGYLGPDLTNIISQPGKGKQYIQAMVVAGNKQMPAFHLSDLEMDELFEFLLSVDASGKADPRQWKINNYGMIEKHE